MPQKGELRAESSRAPRFCELSKLATPCGKRACGMRLLLDALLRCCTRLLSSARSQASCFGRCRSKASNTPTCYWALMFQASFDAEGVFAIQGGLDATCFGPFREEDVYYFGTVKVAERSLHPNLSQFPLLRGFGHLRASGFRIR